MNEKPLCKDCRFWIPRYQGVGVCDRQNVNSSPLFSRQPDSAIMTVANFRCDAGEKIVDYRENSL